uniref:response regulator n=1 Tax=Candidatus Electronema sp. TaxID=2698783 RepID=UPI0040570904
MKKVLLVDDDELIHELIESALSKHSDTFELIHAFDVKSAMAILERDDIALIVTDLVMPGGDGFQLISQLHENRQDIPCIVMTSYELPELGQRLEGKVFQLFKKPVMSQELAEAILRGLKSQQKRGDLGEFSVVGIVQLMETEGTTCRLDVHRSSDHRDINQCIVQNCKEFRGSLFLVQGTVYDAVCGKLTGEEAALKLLSMEGVQVSSCFLDSKSIVRRVHKSNQNLLINAMIQKDHQREAESEDAAEAAPPQQKLLDEGIRLCERLEFSQAQKPLMSFVKENRQCAAGWLWLSRAVTEPKKIKAALAEAHRLEPEHGDIMEDVEKARLLGSAAADIKVIRCPFCYAPLEPTATGCGFCKACLLTESASLTKLDPIGIEQRLLRRAASRFEKVLAAEVNPKILFYAGAAYLNLNDFDKALTYFDLLMPIIQVDSRHQKVAEQVGQIVEYIASSQRLDERGPRPEQVRREKQIIDNQVNKRTVLVVEDSPTTRKVIKMTLQGGGFRVIEAVDGVEALSKLNDDRPDLVLLDIMLPKIDGYKILSILKKNGDTKEIPVVMLTSKNRIIDKVKGHLSSASAYLTKPFKPAELISVVSSILDKHAPESVKAADLQPG